MELAERLKKSAHSDLLNDAVRSPGEGARGKNVDCITELRNRLAGNAFPTVELCAEDRFSTPISKPGLQRLLYFCSAFQLGVGERLKHEGRGPIQTSLQYEEGHARHGLSRRGVLTIFSPSTHSQKPIRHQTRLVVGQETSQTLVGGPTESFRIQPLAR